MRRALEFITRNWPLKLAAIGLAMLLYAGLVVSQNASTWRGQIPINSVNQPTTSVLLGDLPAVTAVRYFTLDADAASRLSSENFVATVDLATARPIPDSPYSVVSVVVHSADSRIRVIDWSPAQITVRLDPLISKSVPVVVDRGEVPSGLVVQDPIVVPDRVTVFGAASVVRLVEAAEARVQIQPSGLSIDQPVDLVAIDARGEVVAPVRIDPQTVRVQVRVGSLSATRTLPVGVVVSGSLPPTVELAGIEASPAVATVTGDPEVVAGLASIATAPVDLSAITATTSTDVGLAPPVGVSVIGSGTVTVTVRVQPRVGTRSLAAGITLRGARPDRTYSLGAETVLVTLGGTLAALNAVDAGSFTATVDVGGLSEGRSQVPVRVTPPPGLNVVAVSPATVTVTVTPAPTQPPATPAPTSTVPPATEAPTAAPSPSP